MASPESCLNIGRACSGPKPSHTYERSRSMLGDKGRSATPSAGGTYLGTSQGGSLPGANPFWGAEHSMKPSASPPVCTIIWINPLAKQKPLIFPEIPSYRVTLGRELTLPVSPCVSVNPTPLLPGQVVGKERGKGIECEVLLFFSATEQ